MIKHIIFDMGGVLIHFDPQYFIARLGISGEDAMLLYQEVFRSLEWVQLDRGTISEQDAIKQIMQRVPARLQDSVEKLVSMWDRPILPIEGMAELIGNLKAAGYGIYLLSNASLRQPDYWMRVPGHELFDGTLISANVQLLKPEAEFYDLMLKKFSLKAEECIFIDDNANNIAGAKSVGIHSYLFDGDATALRNALGF